MVQHVRSVAPDVDQLTLILTGATEIRQSFPIDQQPDVIEGYMTGLKVVFAMCIAATGIATFVGLATRWTRLEQEQRSTGGAV
jgi:hypothetical protein